MTLSLVTQLSLYYILQPVSVDLSSLCLAWSLSKSYVMHLFIPLFFFSHLKILIRNVLVIFLSSHVLFTFSCHSVALTGSDRFTCCAN
ncbi:hypothetical protein B0H34DRAFT_253186 [Crassisporium funariophilum]|nr:hypothetical protein B0H34DRAFT_253186 [Crassisporium funariophilum]